MGIEAETWASANGSVNWIISFHRISARCYKEVTEANPGRIPTSLFKNGSGYLGQTAGAVEPVVILNEVKDPL
jgi:hypothetical protein